MRGPAIGESTLAVSPSIQFMPKVWNRFIVSPVGPNLSLHMQTKMMAYDRVVTELNVARLRGTFFPIVHSLIEASLAVASDVSSFTCSILLHLLKYFLAQSRAIQMTQNFHILAKITEKPPALPSNTQVPTFSTPHSLNANSLGFI
jgi:hypothetical protein